MTLEVNIRRPSGTYRLGCGRGACGGPARTTLCRMRTSGQPVICRADVKRRYAGRDMASEGGGGGGVCRMLACGACDGTRGGEAAEAVEAAKRLLSGFPWTGMEEEL